MTWPVLALGALACAAVAALTFLRNLPRFRRLAPASGRRLPPVSVLVPARDEAENIGACLETILRESRVPLEVVVLDDGSTDETAAIVRAIASRDARVRLAEAPALPAGWCGKQHACWQLASTARHELLVFLDADVRLEAGALPRIVERLLAGGEGLISGFPRQITRTPLERWLLPLIHFVLLGFLPMWRMQRSTHPAYGAGCGQLMAVRRDAYLDAGGHAALRTSLHDGIMLPRALRAAGHRTDLFDATDIARCRMYRSAGEVWAGLGKNAGEGLGAPATIVPASIVLLWGQVLPLPLLAAALALQAPAWTTLAAGGACALSILPRAVSAVRYRQPLDGVVAHPLGVSLLLAIQWQALVRRLRGRGVAWRDRRYGAETSGELHRA